MSEAIEYAIVSWAFSIQARTDPDAIFRMPPKPSSVIAAEREWTTRREQVPRAIISAFKALRRPYTCTSRVAYCGGECNRLAGHEPPCSCSGEVPDTCEA